MELIENPVGTKNFKLRLRQKKFPDIEGNICETYRSCPVRIVTQLTTQIKSHLTYEIAFES